MTTTATIAIGRNLPLTEKQLTLDKLSPGVWRQFQSQTHRVISLYASEIYSDTVGIGTYLRQREETHVWVVSLRTPKTLENLRYALADLATEYGQDSIALTLGSTEFVTKDNRRPLGSIRG